MHLGCIYLVVNDFEKSIKFYEQILQIPVTKRNMDRFAMFCFEEKCISIMNGHFDSSNPDKVVHKGEYSNYFDDLVTMALAPNTHKFVLNFWDEDLKKEYERVKSLDIAEKITGIKYVCNVAPYYFFQFIDPDGNIIEVTGEYEPSEGEFDE
jgi:predicted enzyme related to lactoylglutathione lyase